MLPDLLGVFGSSQIRHGHEVLQISEAMGSTKSTLKYKSTVPVLAGKKMGQAAHILSPAVFAHPQGDYTP